MNSQKNMENSKQLILSTAYLPCIEYIAQIKKHDVCYIENDETFQKQSYRNRTYLLTATGVQSLIVPTEHHTQRCNIKEVRIDYTCRWQQQHWRTIESNYGGSAFFLYYRDFLAPFFEKKYTFLFDFNMEILYTLLQIFHIHTPLLFTQEYRNEYPTSNDLRQRIHPKKPLTLNLTPYTQVFSDRQPFMANLSVIDLLFNMGPDSQQWL